MLRRFLVLFAALALFACRSPELSSASDAGEGSRPIFAAALGCGGTGVCTTVNGATQTPAANNDSGLPLVSNGTGSAPSFQTPPTNWCVTNGGDVACDAGTLTVTRIQSVQVSDAGPSTGNALIYNGSQWTPSTPTWINSTLGTNGVCDWTAQTTTTLTADGTFNFCGGLTFTKVNSANEATHAQVTTGTGINFKPASSTQFSGAVRTAPMVLLGLSTIIPGFTPYTPVEVCYDATSNINADFDEGFLGIDTGANMPLAWRFGAGHNATFGQQIAMTVNAGTSGINGFAQSLTNVGAATGGASDVVMCMQMPLGVATSDATEGTTTTAYDGGASWPDTIPRAVFLVGGVGSNGNWPTASSGYSLAIGAQRQASATSLSFTVLQMRVRYKQ